MRKLASLESIIKRIPLTEKDIKFRDKYIEMIREWCERSLKDPYLPVEFFEGILDGMDKCVEYEMPVQYRLRELEIATELAIQIDAGTTKGSVDRLRGEANIIKALYDFIMEGKMNENFYSNLETVSQQENR